MKKNKTKELIDLEITDGKNRQVKTREQEEQEIAERQRK